MVVWTNTLVDPNLKASTKKKCQLKSGGGWIYFSLVIVKWYEPPTILNGPFATLRLPIPFNFLAFHSPKCPTQWWSRPGMEWPQTRQGKLPVMDMSWESLESNTWQLQDLLHPKHLWHGSAVNPAPFFGSSLVLLSFRSQHNLGDQKKTTQDATKTRSDINIPSGTYSAYKRWLLTYEKMASISTKSPRPF